MKKGTKIGLITGVILALIFAIYRIFFYEKETKNNSESKGSSKKNQKPNKVFKKLQNEFKNDTDKLKLLNTAERIMRLESGNFTSNIFNKTQGGGFIAVTDDYPFGFSSPTKVWEEYGKPSDVYESSNGNNYIIFPNLEIGVRSIIALLEGYYKNGHTTGHYYEGDEDYVKKLNSFKDSEMFTENFENNKYLEE